MSIKDKIVSLILSEDYSIVKKIEFRGKRWLSCINVACYAIPVAIIIGYVLYKGRQYRTYENDNSFVNVKVNRAIRTNFTYDQFNQSFINPEDLPLYNRVWVATDYTEVGQLNRALVFTNIIVAPNQTLSTCPEHPTVANASCDPSLTGECVEGKIMSRGIQTGRCVRADFPEWNNTEHKFTYGFTCEKEGWCPTNRFYMPLNDEKALLSDTKNSLLYIKIALPFPEFDFTLINENKTTLTDILNCRWHPVNDPYCQFYLLEDVVKFTPNIRQSYDEFAKEGGTISIDISWYCTMPLFSKFDWLRDCKLNYKLNRLDNQYDEDKLGPKSYSRIFTYENNRRTYWRIYGIELVVNPHAILRVWNWYEFVTAVGALLSYVYVFPRILENFVRSYYKNLNLDQIIVDDVTDERIDTGFQQSSDSAIESVTEDVLSDTTRLIGAGEPINTDENLEASDLFDTREAIVQSTDLSDE